MRERIEAMKAIWTEDEASYSGKYVDFERIWCWPKPAQKPHPPVLVGGNGAQVLDRVLAFGDEWMPNRIVRRGPGGARRGARRPRCGGRPRSPIPVTMVGYPPDPAGFERLARRGVGRVVFWLPQDSAGAVEEGFGRYVRR